MKQREAVYNAITSVFTESNVHFEDGMDASALLTDDLRKNVHSILTEGFSSGTIDMEKTISNRSKLEDTKKMSAYVSGLISNWVRKDKRLNGGVSYVAKNPGSRVGQGDEQLKTLRALHRQFAGTDETKAAEIQRFIDARVQAIRSSKTSTVKVDTSSLPAELKASLGIE